MKPHDIPTARVAELIGAAWNHGKAQSAKAITIIRAVSEACQINELDITSHIRTAPIAIPRMLSMALCRRLTHLGCEEIANFHGRSHHATAIHAAKRMRAQADEIVERIKNAEVRHGEPDASN